MATYLQDTFDRANSGSWGTRSDGLDTWSTIDAGSGYGWSITSNQGLITGNWNGQRGAYTGLSQHNNVRIRLDVTTTAQWELSGGRAESVFIGVLKGTTGQNGSTMYGIRLWGDNSGSKGLSIIDNGTEKASVSFPTTNSTTYHIEIIVNSNYQMDVYVYTGSRPATPTLSFTNGGSPYTPTASGAKFGLEYSPNESTTGTAVFDSLIIDDIPLSPVAKPISASSMGNAVKRASFI